jgi:hypothetical protein
VTELSYTPQFEHLDWIDRVDQVVAAGPNGFNIRFRTIEHDLQQASTVVGQIATALHTTHRAPPGGIAPPPQLTFTPNLRSVGTHGFTLQPNGTPAGISVLTRTSGGGAAIGFAATGVANVSLPEGQRVTTIRFVGSIDGSGGSTKNKAILAFVRGAIPVSGSPAVETLASVQATGVGPFDLQATAPGNLALTDIHRFWYAIKADHEAQAPGNSALILEYVQITFAPTA